MSGLQWVEVPLRPGQSGQYDHPVCQGEGCTSRKARHEPVVAGWPVEPEPMSNRFLLCRSCRTRWERVWESGGRS